MFFNRSRPTTSPMSFILRGRPGPKGVEITHGNLSHLVAWHVNFAVTHNDRTTHISGPGFDAAAWELWPCLSSGASIHLPRSKPVLRSEVEGLAGVGKDYREFPSDCIGGRGFALAWPVNTSLRILLTGGDALHIFPPAGLPFEPISKYGPTECTVVATSAAVKVRGQTACARHRPPDPEHQNLPPR